MENTAAASLLRSSIQKIQDPHKLRDIVSDFILQIRTQMNSTEDKKLLYPMMDRGYFVLSEIEKENLLPEKPLSEVLSKIHSYGSWNIDAITEQMPQSSDRIRYEAHRLFISFILNVQRLEISEHQKAAAEEAYYKKFSDRLVQVSQ